MLGIASLVAAWVGHTICVRKEYTRKAIHGRLEEFDISEISSSCNGPCLKV